MKYRTLKDKKKAEEEQEAKINQTFITKKGPLQAAMAEKKRKKKTAKELMEMIDITGVVEYQLKAHDTYIPRSYNLDRQIDGLVNHMFAKYPVPSFLYKAYRKTDRPRDFHFMYDEYRRWFIALAQGKSFPKMVKGLMTSKEAYLFLSAPSDNEIHENVWWAKMKMAGIPDVIINKLIERIFSRYFPDDPSGRLHDVIHFYARYHQDMNKITFQEVTEFISWKLNNEREFSFKGRTVSSMLKMSAEWHVLMQKAKLGHHCEWPGLGWQDWVFEDTSYWVITEIRSNKELMNEGRKLKHCVYGYVQWCVEGRSAIFSLRGHNKLFIGYDEEGVAIWDRGEEYTRVTIEVRPRERVIPQVRGLQNRPPTPEESQRIRMWAGAKGLRITSYAIR